MGVNISPSGVAVAHFNGSGDSPPSVSACEFESCQGTEAQASALARIVDQLNLAGAPANFVLNPSQYSLLLVEPPDVPAEDLKQAVRWRIKDLVDFSVDDAAVDIITLPDDAFRGRAKMIYVVAAARKVIDEAERMVNDAGLKLRYVDIAETTLSNLLHWSDTESHSAAILYLRRDDSLLNLIKNDRLYLTRNIKADVTALSRPGEPDRNAFDHLLLETQRSLDYYESQLGQPPATELFVVPFAEGVDLSESLKANLGLNAHHITFSAFMQGTETIAEAIRHDCLMALAAGLREEAV